MRIKQIILERKMADLYHYTYGHNLEDILNDKAIMPNNGWVSLTRDKRYNYMRGQEDAVRFIIDQGKLTNNVRLEPYDWNNSTDDFNDEDGLRDPEDRRSESEERTKRPVPLNCIKLVELSNSWNPRQLLQDITDMKNSSDRAYTEWMLPGAIKKVQEKLVVLKQMKKMGIPFRFTI